MLVESASGFVFPDSCTHTNNRVVLKMTNVAVIENLKTVTLNMSGTRDLSYLGDPVSLNGYV